MRATEWGAFPPRSMPIAHTQYESGSIETQHRSRCPRALFALSPRAVPVLSSRPQTSAKRFFFSFAGSVHGVTCHGGFCALCCGARPRACFRRSRPEPVATPAPLSLLGEAPGSGLRVQVPTPLHCACSGPYQIDQVCPLSLNCTAF